MDRETRRANFKKLQQPATTKLRTTRSSKAAAATTTLSDYFSTPESISNDVVSQEQEVRPRNTDKDDLCAEPKNKKTRECIDTKPAALPKPKKAPKLKSSTSTRRGRGTGRGRSKQPSISDFLRNEQLFAEVTAQHCMADNFSPDDIEMALALSKSEAEKHGVLRLQDTVQEEEEVVNLLDDKANQSTENIRRKLQKYGFRTAAKEDYNAISIGALPAATGKRGKRCKWANKFTPLTLRNPEEQLKKLDTKVAALMAQQVRTKLPKAEELQMLPLKLISARLQRLEATARIIHEPNEGVITNLNTYYVQDLMEVSRTPANHLLKSWAAIQGRDLSPKRPSSASRLHQQQLEKIYAELEAHFADKESEMSATAEKAELDELEKLVADNMVEEHESTLNVNSPLKEPPDKRARMTQTHQEIHEEKENLQPSSLAILTVPTQSTRCTSPDLFADSDEELDLKLEIPATLGEMQNMSLKVYKDTNSKDINCYEIYSSDEVKNAKEINTPKDSPALFVESFVDLTEEQDSPALPEYNTNAEDFYLDEPITALSPTIEFADEPDVLNCTLARHLEELDQDCVISDELYAKYAHKTVLEEEQIKLDSNCLSVSKVSSAASMSSTSFQLATTLTTSKDSSMPATSFQLPTTPCTIKDNSLNCPPSLSLTQTPRHLQLENSFKSPLSGKSNSITDKPASMCSHSDASIDLTQDSCDEDADDGGVLLSDDEINYSIWQADKTHRNRERSISPLAKRKTMPYFQTLEDLDAFLDTSPAASIKSCNSRSPNKSALSKERAEFGILDAALSQPFTLSQLPSEQAETSQVQIDWAEASFLDPPTELPLKRYSSSSHKFKQFLNNMTNPAAEQLGDDFDEFDKMVFQSAKDASIDKVPSGLDRLLMGDINMDNLPEPEAPVQPASPAKVTAKTEQLEVNGQVYTIRVCQTPKPDFVLMAEAELLQHLYNYGIKPLKRKHAVKLLEFIYNQTHPIMLPLEEPQPQPQPLPRSKSTPVTSGKSKQRNPLLHSASNDCLTPTEGDTKLSYKFRDACGAELLRFSQAVPPALCDDFEFYVLQTNVTKKTPQPLLPLHIAWHNLLCANPSLHESVLMYEPIDLQEIYQYLKQLGHRYDPKDLKCFFDRRCIIFRYELAPPTKQVNRHIRKKPKKSSSKFL